MEQELATIADVVLMAQRRRMSKEPGMVQVVLSLVLAITRGTRVKLARRSEVAQCLADEFAPLHDIWNHIAWAKEDTA